MKSALSLSPLVSIQDGEIVDAARAQRIKSNPTALMFIVLGENLREEEVVRTVSEQTDMPLATVRRDFLKLRSELNANALVNVPARNIKEFLWNLVHAAGSLIQGRPAVWLSPHLTRMPIDTSSLGSAFTSTARATAPLAALFGLSVSLVFAAVQALAMQADADPLVNQHLLSVVAGFAVTTAIILHEAGHAFTLKGMPTVCVRRGMRLGLLHPPQAKLKSDLTALAGPLLCGAFGVATTFAVSFLGSVWLLPVPLIFSLQLVGLTVLSEDGRNLIAGRPKAVSWVRDAP